MPQMSPMNWTTLMLFFTISMLMFLTLNFFLSESSIKNKMTKKQKKMNYWKW